ncbi:MAG TPA: serine--tRNA ligase [Patescibacteria group bacterium]
MLDIKFIRDNQKLVQENAGNKGIKIDIKKLLKLDDQRRKLITKIEKLNSQKNQANQEIAKAKGADKAKKIKMMKKVADKISQLNPELSQVEKDYYDQMSLVPQIVDKKTPVDPEGKKSKIERRVGNVPHFNFKQKDHLELGRLLDIIDLERGVRVMGTRGYFLKNEGALLENAVLNYALDFLRERKFVQLSVPVLADEKYFIGTGYFPFMRSETFVAQDKDREFYLIGSAEVPLCGYYAGEILREEDLPVRLMALSPCFRTEVGSYGQDTKGLYRLKQFYKVEQVVLCENDDQESKKMFDEILGNAEDFMQSLELPYQLSRLSTGEMGAGQVEKFDIETWMPSRASYSETHSCSRFGDWQARRLNIRYKTRAGENKFVHTLNNTLIATPRILIPLLEINQQAGGTVDIPQILRKYMSGLSKIERK